MSDEREIRPTKRNSIGVLVSNRVHLLLSSRDANDEAPVTLTDANLQVFEAFSQRLFSFPPSLIQETMMTKL